MTQPGNLLRLVLLGVATAWPLSGSGQTDLAGAFKRASDAANESRRRMQSERNSTPSSSTRSRDRAADEPSAADRAEDARVAKVNGDFDAAKAAARAGNAREALRLARESLGLAKDRDFRKTLANWIKELETYIAKDEARQKANAALASGEAAFKQHDYRGTLLFYRQALAADPEALGQEGKDFIVQLEAQVKREEQSDRASQARSELERKNGPQVARLNREAEALVETHPAEAVARLDAALKLLPGDRKTVATWWWATASLALREQRFEDAVKALGKAGDYDLDPAVVAAWQKRVEGERGRQAETVLTSFVNVRERLAASSGAAPANDLGFIAAGQVAQPAAAAGPVDVGQNTNAGDQLMSAAAAARTTQDLTPNFDLGTARSAGSLPTVTRSPVADRVARDPRVQAETRQLAALQSRRAELEKEREQLTQQRNAAKEPEKMRELSTKLEEASRQYQENLVAVANQEQVVQKTRRIIEFEVEPPESAPPATDPPAPPP